MAAWAKMVSVHPWIAFENLFPADEPGGSFQAELSGNIGSCFEQLIEILRVVFSKWGKPRPAMQLDIAVFVERLQILPTVFGYLELGLGGAPMNDLPGSLATGAARNLVFLQEYNARTPSLGQMEGRAAADHTAEQTQVGRIITGETVLGQHPTTLHFGLGSSTRVESIEVRWSNGMTRIVHDPKIDRYHRIEAPGTDRLPPP